MKQLIALLILCAAWWAQAAAPIGTNISRYPNTNVAPASSLLLLAVTNEVPATNYNILITDFLRQATNTAVITNWTILAQPASANLTNWSLIPTGAMANVVSVTYITNAINNISNYINTSGLLSLQTNGVSVTTLMTNLNLLYGTGMVVRTTNANGNVAVQVSAEVTQAGASVIASNAANSLGVWTNDFDPLIGHYARQVQGTTNSLKVLTNGLQGIAIGDINAMIDYQGWPYDGLTFMSLLDGSSGHNFNEFFFGVVTASGDALVRDVSADLGSISFGDNISIETNGTTANFFNRLHDRFGVSWYIQDGSGQNTVGLMIGSPNFQPFGGNSLYVESGGVETFKVSTNGPIFMTSTGLLGGLVVTQDIRFLGHNSASNSLWVCTNATTGEGRWRTADEVGLSYQTNLLNTSNFLATSSIDVKTNQTMMVLQQTPNAGSQWYVGTNGTPTTNEARSGLEFNAFWRSLRMGEVFGGSDIYGLVGNGSNYWNNTNLGPLTVGFGSNAFVKAAFASVLGGRNNAILTNAENSVIGGGINNLIDTNVVNGVIGGGGRNSIRSTNSGSAAVLSIANITIGGGSNNNVLGIAKWATIGGGGDNTVLAAGEATISGGFGNTINDDARFGYIGGGNNNTLGVAGGGVASATDSGVIGGGSQNIGKGDYVTIGGGLQNQMFIGDDYCTIGGGQLNIIGVTPNNFATHATISGGSSGLIQQNSHFSVIGGGNRNQILSASTNSTISGGEDNVIQANAPFANILGGRDNTITGTGDYGTVIGFSNQVSAEAAIAIGRNVTNSTANAVMVSELVSYNTPAVIAGAGTGSTNYTLQLTSPEMVLGSSNVNIVAAMGWIDGKTHNWNVSITNLSADTWGFSFSQVSNRVKWQSWMYGTNAPRVLTNNTVLRISGTSTGTNTLAEFKYFSPAL